MIDKLTEVLAAQLREYEEAEARGDLLRLPCKLGDTVYCIRRNPKGKYVKENKVNEIVYTSYGFVLITTLRDLLGTSVFLTREEAEAALKEG